MDHHPSAGQLPDQLDAASLPTFSATSLTALLCGAIPQSLHDLLIEHTRKGRWFRGKARDISGLEILDCLPLRPAPDEVMLIVLRVVYRIEAAEVYVLPMAVAAEATATPSIAAHRRLFVLQPPTCTGHGGGLVYDPSGDQALCRLLLDLFVRARTPGARGIIIAQPTDAFASRVRVASPRLPAHLPSGEQSNTTVFFGQEFTLKLFRQWEAGENPDVEVNEFLWAHGYRHVPEPLGSVRYEGPGFHATLGIAQRFVANARLAWDVTLEILSRSIAAAYSIGDRPIAPEPPGDDLLESADRASSPQVQVLIGPYAAFATQLGQRTAELHLALASGADSAAFSPEPFTPDEQRSMVRAAHDRVEVAFALLARQRTGLPDDIKPLAERVFECRDALVGDLDGLASMRIAASRIRCHGDYHLGQVLYAANDFTILDFEGEPAQPLDMRRRKGSALYDVCGMLRSFHYAGTVARRNERARHQGRSGLARWCEAWYWWTSATFLSAYLRRAREGGAVFLPESSEQLRALLQLHLVDKCSYELSYELNNRPAWVGVPLAGLLSLAHGG
jgi:trehalose synthase-fused probable maltokinase